MKTEIKIKRLKKIDKLNIFDFIDCEHALIILCNYVEVCCGSTYQNKRKFLKLFYKDFKETLKQVNEMLNTNEVMYGHEPSKHLKFIKKILEEQLNETN